jgi:hypothetical protein
VMGQVRDKIEGRTPGVRSPKEDLKEVKETLYDLLQKKSRDYVDEGPIHEQANLLAMERLKNAINSVTDAIGLLDQY